ncbi:hypothetical protein PV08_04030 [Exophiala spinifera]|uniref:Uncharacterized protein n=1 Tax=Exophiala spinifera TaxID=91928 RepID=A0A0D2BE16_9EURO|nr:uncharacterized protein PV08_04030 [Exophiala spinifera]KIW16840.1 hypothetical protein PV08_04030 [Exophiala spinifera]
MSLQNNYGVRGYEGASWTSLSTDKPLLYSQEQLLPQEKRRFIHWRAPTVMIVSFAIGVLGAILHHVLYFTFNNRIVSFDHEQQIISTSGLALAFIVKVSLAASSATAFTQCLWRSLRSSGVKIRAVDSMFDVLTNPFEFLYVKVWVRHPLLTLTAATTWLIPLSAIFTPSTLTVRPLMHESTEVVQVPQRQNNDSQLSMLTTNDGSSWIYFGTSTTFLKVANLNIQQGGVLPVSLELGSQNLSYTLDFYGPALQCVEPDSTTTATLRDGLYDYMNQTGNMIYWAGFVPQSDFGPSTINATFFEALIDGKGQYNFSTPNLGLEAPSNGPAKAFHMMYSSDNMTAIPAGNWHYDVAECTLHNASYNSHFELSSNGQQVITASRQVLKGIEGVQYLPTKYTVDEAAERFNAQAFMQAFGYYASGTTTIKINGNNFTPGSSVQVNPVLGAAISGAMYSDPAFTTTWSQFTGALESLFQNFTLSYRYSNMQFGYLEQNYSSHVATQATLRQSLNTFTYAPRALFISYAVAIGLSAICLGVGVHAIHVNRLSYANSFSTILRVTRDKAFDALVENGEAASGADPLPKHVANVTVTYFNQIDAQDGRGAAGMHVLS